MFIYNVSINKNAITITGGLVTTPYEFFTPSVLNEKWLSKLDNHPLLGCQCPRLESIIIENISEGP
jgi:hypothetical protein